MLWLALLVGASASMCGEDPNALAKALSTLKSQGYTVDQGQLYFDPNATAFGANPSSPYGLFIFGGRAVWRIDAQDAFIFHGCTPPPVAYFSFRSYIFSSPDHGIVFAALGDSLNLLEVKARAATGNFPFNSLISVVTTADEQSYSDVANAWNSAGLGDTMNIPDAIPLPWATKMGSQGVTDTFAMLVRVALPQPGQEQAYQQYINTNQTVYRIHNASGSSSQPRKPFALPIEKNREGPTSESGLQTALSKLTAAFMAAKKKEGLNLVDTFQVTGRATNSSDCIAGRATCAGNNNDALYGIQLRMAARMTTTDRFFLVGVNHNASGLGVYSNLAVYHGMNSTNLAMSNPTFAGSANKYLSPQDEPLVTQLFVVLLARSCDGSQDVCLKVDEQHLPSDEAFSIGTRAYLNPKTLTGPAQDQIITETLYQFQ